MSKEIIGTYSGNTNSTVQREKTIGKVSRWDGKVSLLMDRRVVGRLDLGVVVFGVVPVVTGCTTAGCSVA